ncbi:MAG: hypothetical protein H6Q71_2733 [Firmicutes bacterium]|nr:hypothetical protein [Bacillota bacterium]
MTTVICKLTDCVYHGLEICTAKRARVDGVGQVECYEPIPHSSIVHREFDSGCDKSRRGYKSNRVTRVIK